MGSKRSLYTKRFQCATRLSVVQEIDPKAILEGRLASPDISTETHEDAVEPEES